VKPQEIIDRFVHLARRASEDSIDGPGPAGLHRLERALAGSRRPRPSFVWIGGCVLAAALSATIAVLLIPRDRALTFEVTQGCVREGGYVVSKAADGAVRFSDHSDLGMDQGTRLRVSNVDVHGAHLMLEAGTLHVSIRPRRLARWSFDAGPYVVHVTGTAFDLAWEVERQTLDLRLHEGSVTVEGPLAGGDIHMIAGDHLVANAGDGSLSIVDERNVGPSQDRTGISAVSETGPAGPVSSSRSTPAPSPTRPGTGSVFRPSGGPWAARVARGDFEAVVDDARRQGIDRVLSEAPQADLAALADAARYARHQDLARRVLVAQRARFAGSVLAKDAAFFLGDLAEGRQDAALSWYETYLYESPDGAYASQALGRKMTLVQQLRGAEAARATAAEYLQRFGDGPYAPNARKLLRAQ